MLYGLCFNNFTWDNIGRDEVGEYIVDTCYTADQGYETAVWKTKKDNMIIVERYADREDAEKGHEKWKSFCSINPTRAWSVQFDDYIDF